MIGAFVGALKGAVEETHEREAAGLTFLITASGINILGISAPFWGLLAGIVMLAGIVGTIVIAMFMPMISLINNM